MAYIGKQPVVGNFVKLDAITTSATTTFNLLNGGVAYFPQTANNCLVSLNGILQAPTDSYTISGSTIIFSNALTTSDVIDFIIVLGDVLAIGTPSDATVTSAKIVDGTIGLAKLSATGTKDATTFLRGDNTFTSAASSAKIFSVYRSGNQSVSNNTATKVQFNAEEYDANNWFDSTTNYRLTPTTAGYYYLTATLFTNANGGANPTTSIIYLYKNGSQYKWFISQQSGSSGQFSAIISTVVYANGSSDYFECYGQTSNAGVPVIQGGSDTTHFSGFYIGS